LTVRRLAAVLAALVAACGGAATASAQTPIAGATTVVVSVRPAVADVPVLLHGARYVTDAAGHVTVPATPEELANDWDLLRQRIRVPPARLGPSLRVRFSRWVGRTATVVLLRPVEVHLVDPTGKPLAPREAPRVVVRGTDGSERSLRTGEVSWLAASQPVRRPGGEWRLRRLSYGINEVLTHGVNVVHRGQQRFTPARERRVSVEALFFVARFSARDALFGNAIGEAMHVRFPDGHTERHAFGPDGTLVLTGLPRGDYVVRVEGPGVSFSRPVALSKSQDVELQVISWIDLVVVAGVLMVLAVALVLAGRPDLRPALRPRRLHAGGSSDG
jgi:hypothetical protein